MGSIVEHLINGRKVSRDDDRYQDLYNPATGEVTAQVA
jgi:malonate-semialdehyde dehydrogenase (acetylating)/methylmalonate-semialdehyde dehydrogenase